jgi:hypothetical protein
MLGLALKALGNHLDVVHLANSDRVQQGGRLRVLRRRRNRTERAGLSGAAVASRSPMSVGSTDGRIRRAMCNRSSRLR